MQKLRHFYKIRANKLLFSYSMIISWVFSNKLFSNNYIHVCREDFHISLTTQSEAVFFLILKKEDCTKKIVNCIMALQNL